MNVAVGEGTARASWCSLLPGLPPGPGPLSLIYLITSSQMHPRQACCTNNLVFSKVMTCQSATDGQLWPHQSDYYFRQKCAYPAP